MNTHLPTGKDYPIASAKDVTEGQMSQRGSDGATGIGETMGQESRYNTRSASNVSHVRATANVQDPVMECSRAICQCWINRAEVSLAEEPIQWALVDNRWGV